MKNLACILLFASLTQLWNGCSIACKSGHGPVRGEAREVGDFDALHLNIPAQVTVTQGERFLVEVEAEDNLLDEIRTKVKGRTLRISSEGCLKPNIRIKVHVSLPELTELEINGTGDILVPDTFRVEDVDLAINGTGNIECRLIAARVEAVIRGSGDVRLTGSANEQELKIMGSGDIDAMQMPCNTAEIRVSGSGDVYVYVIRDLDIRISGSGDAYYKGKPKVSTKINGSGKVVDRN